jgi:hypothetical protein
MITGNGHDGLYLLLNKDDSKVTLESFKETHGCELKYAIAPHKPSSIGAIFVSEDGPEYKYFPSVYDTKWVKVNKENI